MKGDQARSATVSGAPAAVPWVGREPELSVLGQLLLNVSRGMGGCALVEGPPGIGKTGLVEQALLRAVPRQVTVLRGTADEFCVSLPFQLIANALQPLSTPRPVSEPGSLWGASTRNALTVGVNEALTLVERACATMPVVLVTSDLQWADEASMTVLSSLARLTAQLPLLVVGELTTGSQRDEVRRLRRALLARDPQVLRLAPLDPDESARLAGAFLSAPIAAELRRLNDQAAGNPLHIQELTAALTRDDLIEVRDGVARFRLATGAEALPSSLGAAISDRLGYLAPDTLEALRAASLLGAAFDHSELSVVLGWPAPRVAAALGEATASGILTPAGPQVHFQVPLLRSALYQSMPIFVRSIRHRQTAQLLSEAGWPMERVAAQLVQAGGSPDAWSLQWLATSGTTLLYRTPQLAVDLLLSATGHLSWDDPRREPLEAILAMAAFLRGKLDDARRAAERVLARTDSAARAAEMTWLLGYIHIERSGFSEAATAIESAASWDLDEVWQARLTALRAKAQLRAACYDKAQALATEALSAGHRLSDPQAIGYASITLAYTAHVHRRYEEALVHLDEGLNAVADTAELAEVRLNLLINKWLWMFHLDRPDEAVQEIMRLALSIAEAVGTATRAAIMVFSAVIKYRMGQWDDALAELEAVDEEELAEKHMRVFNHGLHALIAVQCNLPDRAREQLGLLGDLTQYTGLQHNGSQYQLQAEVLLAEAEGRYADALALLESLATDVRPGTTQARLDLMPLVVRMGISAGQQKLAATAAERAEHDARSDPRPVTQATAQHCRGLLTGSPGPLREALAYHRGSGRVPKVAACAEDLAVVLAGSGELAAAREALNEAASAYLTLGATAELQRADARWRDAGLRRNTQGTRCRPATGWAALTPTEQRIARLVGEGLSNPDIADHLYTSRRTVQTHVTHILAKLKMRSRAEVARAVPRQPDAGPASARTRQPRMQDDVQR